MIKMLEITNLNGYLKLLKTLKLQVDVAILS